jgi:endonuclease/exonuclease/phosphatase family metal-dependent hydrolase
VHDTILVSVSAPGLGDESVGEDVTVATYNILGANAPNAKQFCKNNGFSSDTTKCADQRSTLQAKIMSSNGGSDPAFDIVGLQEATPLQVGQLTSKLSGYQTYPAQSGLRDHDATAIMWNSSKFTRVSTGTSEPIYPNDGSKKPISQSSPSLRLPWVGLQSTSGQTFYVMSIHSPNDLYGNQAKREYNAKVFREWAKSKKDSGGIAIVLGDFNEELSTGAPNGGSCYIITNGGILQNSRDAYNKKDAAKPCPDRSANYPPLSNSRTFIDQIYLTPGVLESAGWNYINPGGDVSKASDHRPEYTSLAINGSGSSDFAWPLDKKWWDTHRSDWLGPHGFTSGSWTNGVDGLAADIGDEPDGSPVYAMFGGRVTQADLGGHGLVISTPIQGGVLEVAYAHGPRTNQNSTYSAGDKIMTVGCLGNCDGGHLHVDMAFNGKGVCPQDVFLAFNEGRVPDFATLTRQGIPPCGRTSS